MLNTAVALGRLGAPVAMLTGLSNDMFGRQLSAHLARAHVDTSPIIWSDRPTTLAFVELQDGEASYCFYDENSAGRLLDIAEVKPLPQGISTLFFGGISLACAPACDCYAALLAREGGKRLVMIDPNIRPGFITDVAGYRQRLEQMMAQADIVKLSQQDLDWLRPGSTVSGQMIQSLLDLGPSLVVLTRGDQGASGFLADGSQVQVPACPTQVKDTVGAGDTFNAGLLAKLAEQGSLSKTGVKALTKEMLHQALQHGAQVAAKTISRIGADPPWASEL